MNIEYRINTMRLFVDELNIPNLSERFNREELEGKIEVIRENLARFTSYLNRNLVGEDGTSFLEKLQMEVIASEEVEKVHQAIVALLDILQEKEMNAWIQCLAYLTLQESERKTSLANLNPEIMNAYFPEDLLLNIGQKLAAMYLMYSKRQQPQEQQAVEVKIQDLFKSCLDSSIASDQEQRSMRETCESEKSNQNILVQFLEGFYKGKSTREESPFIFCLRSMTALRKYMGTQGLPNSENAALELIYQATYKQSPAQ